MALRFMAYFGCIVASDELILSIQASMGGFSRCPYVDCSIEVCESRDVKGLYKRARAGEVKEFTGISAPYELPENPELVVNTDQQTLEESVESVIQLLIERDIIQRV